MLIKFVYIVALLFCAGVSLPPEKDHPVAEHSCSLELQESHDIVAHFSCGVTSNAPPPGIRYLPRLNNEPVCKPAHLNIISPPPEIAS